MKKYFKNSTIKNASWLISGKVMQMVLSLVVSLLTARYLGPSNYGLINYAGAYTAFFMSFCTLGINSILVKEFVNHPEEEGMIIGSTLLLRGISSLLSAGVIVCIVSLVEFDDPTAIAVTALCSIGVVFNVFETFHYWFQSRLQSKVTAMVTLAGYGVSCIYKIVLLVLGKGVRWFALASAVDYICIAVLIVICYCAYGGKKLAFSKTVSKRLLNQSCHFILSGLMVSVYRYSDKFMLKQLTTDADVGYYATATALCGMWCFVLSAIIDSVYPSIMEAHKTDKALYEKRNRQLYAIVFYLSVFVSLMFCVFGELAVWILYGKAYLSSVAPLRVLTWFTAFSYLGVARNAWIVCEDKGKYLKYIYVLAAISNVILNWIFIPLWGAVGAAAASLITQVLTTLVLPFFIKGLRRNSVLMVEAILFKGVK